MSRLAMFVGEGWQKGGSGVGTFRRLVYEAWERDFGCEFVQIPCGSSSAKSCPGEGARSLPNRRQVSPFGLAAGYFRELCHDIRRIRPVKGLLKDRTIVIHEFGCEVFPIALRLMCPRNRIVAIAHTHPGTDVGAQHPLRRLLEHLCYSCVSDVVYNSQSTRTQWARKLGKNRQKGRVIRHGIPDPDSTVPIDYPDKSPGVVDFVCVAQFLSWKGQGALLDAWERALRLGSTNIRLIFVGGGAYLGQIMEQAKTRDLLSSVLFLGARPEGARYFNAADVAILLSTEPEAFGLVLLEAMSRGKPVIASQLGGIPEVVIDHETGILVDPLCLEDIAEVIRKLSASHGDRTRLGQNGLRRWQESFRVERMLREYREYFEATGCVVTSGDD